jgi:methylmalonyl-CoA mutase cobalamin-binding subunit
MGEAARTVDHPRWGRAERAAFDRCLALPSLPSPNFGARQPRLSRLIETEIIPRLMLAHRAERQAAEEVPLSEIGTADIAELASLAVSAESDLSLRFVDRLLDRGAPVEAVLLDALTSGFGPAAGWPACGRILLAPVPGEQHRFGLSVLDALFRQTGWDTAQVDTLKDMRRQLRQDWFDVAGLSLSCDVLFGQVKPTIQALRRASRNPSLFVMVGGRFFVDHPERAAEVGADVAVTDAHDALRQAQPRSGSSMVQP